MHRSWIFVVAVWCVLGRAESASIEDPNQLHDARLIGGGPVDTKLPQPSVAELLVKEANNITKVCEAVLIKQIYGGNYYFLTAAECFDKKSGGNYYIRYHSSHKVQDIIVYKSNARIHPKYDSKTKAHNVAVLIVSYYYGSLDSNYKVVIGDKESGPATAKAEVFTWRNSSVEDDLEFTESYELHSLKTKIIRSFWCNLLYRDSLYKKYHLCASGWFYKGLTKDQIGTPLIQRDPKEKGQLWLTGIATNIKPWAHRWSFPMEFVDVRPYKRWIESIVPK